MTYPATKVQYSEYNSARNAVQEVNTSIISYENEELSFRIKLTIQCICLLVISYIAVNHSFLVSENDQIRQWDRLRLHRSIVHFFLDTIASHQVLECNQLQNGLLNLSDLKRGKKNKHKIVLH